MKPYSWITSGDPQQRLEMLSSVRSIAESIPDTAMTTTTEDVKHSKGRYDAAREMMNYFGMWKVPERFTNNTRTKYVNPRHKDAMIYSDVMARCECGTLVTKDNKRTVEVKGADIHQDCKVEWEKAAIAELWANRRNVIEKSAHYEVPSREMTARLCVSNRKIVWDITQRLGVDWDDMRRTGVRRRWATWRYLHEEGFSLREIGDAFGFAPNSVSEGVGKLAV